MLSGHRQCCTTPGKQFTARFHFIAHPNLVLAMCCGITARNSAYMPHGCSSMAFCALVNCSCRQQQFKLQNENRGALMVQNCLGWVRRGSGPVDGDTMNTMAGQGCAVWNGLASVLRDTLCCKQRCCSLFMKNLMRERLRHSFRWHTTLWLRHNAGYCESILSMLDDDRLRVFSNTIGC
jgi:hypothetical protein